MSIKKKVFDIRNTIGKLQKKQENPFYNSAYFDINDLLDELQPYLETNKILLTQPVRGKDVYSILECMETGEVMESYITIEGLTDPQKVGSAITYYRRYGLKSLLGISEEDDDANKASKSAPKDDGKEWLNATNKDGSLNELGVKVAGAIRDGQRTWDDLKSKYKISKKDRAAIEGAL
jgi:hypothetical protein